MSTVVQYPMNFYSRAITNASGSSPSYQILLLHADRATVSSGTWFVDQTTFDSQIWTRGTSVIQSTAAAYFSTGGILFTNTTDRRIAWTITGITATTATPTKPAVSVEAICRATSLNTAGMYWFDCRDDSETTYARAYLYQDATLDGGGWFCKVDFFTSALGGFLDRWWKLPVSVSSMSWMHLALVHNVSFGSRYSVFYNGSQCTLITTQGFPSGHSGDWSDCSFVFPQGSRFAFGGLAATGSNNWIGHFDEMRVCYGSVDLISYDSFFDIWSVAVPTAPYSPADGTFNITAKVLVLGSSVLMCASDGLLNLGQTGTEWNDLWITGTAYVDQFGESTLFTGSSRIQVRSTDTYMFSSAAGYLTLVAGTQIDLQSNVGMSAVNFIFDTATGVKVGTATNQKLAFWGATPIVRPGSTSDIKDSLVNVGLITDGGATPLNLDGGKLTAGSGSFTASVAVAGAFYATGYHYKVTVIGSATTSYTLTTADDVLVCSVGADASVILPTPSLTGKVYFVKNVASAGTVTISCGTNTAALIDLAATLTLGSTQVARLFDGKTVIASGASFDDWTYRRLLTVTTDTSLAIGTLSSFAMMVRLTTANFTFGHANSDGSDIRFALTDDTLLSHYKLFFGYTLDTTTNVVTGSTVTGDQTGGNWANLSNTTDNNETTFANSFDGAGPHWIRYQLGTARAVNYVKIKPYSNANGRTVKAFTIEGSNDTTGAWTTIYTGSHRDNAHNEAYVFDNGTAYLFYRINCSNSWQTSGLIGIYEVVMYSNATTQMGVFMVNMPTLAAGSTFYVYFGNATAASVSTSGAFNTDYQAVWPMGTIASGSSFQMVDVTSYGRHASATINSIGAPILTWNSLWGYVSYFLGSQALTVADDSVWDDGMVNWTWIMWVLETATSGNKAYVGRGNDGASYLYWGKDNGAALRWRDFNGGPDINTLSPSIVTNSVTMLTMKRSSNNFELFNDATSIGTASNAAALLSRTTPLTIGANSSINYFVNGQMWFLQILTVAQSTGWIKSKYYSDTDQLIATVGAEDTAFGGGGGAVTYHWITV